MGEKQDGERKRLKEQRKLVNVFEGQLQASHPSRVPESQVNLDSSTYLVSFLRNQIKSNQITRQTDNGGVGWKMGSGA